MYTVFGAGSVGTVLAALLAECGVDVAIAGRDAVGRLRVEGDHETIRVEVPVVTKPVAEGSVLLCVHETDVAPLAARWPDRPMIAFVNGVATVAGVDPAVWRMTCMLVEPGVARFTSRGRVIVGNRQLASDLRRAGLDVGVADDISPDRWLKLLVNLASAPNALVRSEDHSLPEFGAAKALLLEEAVALFAQHGIKASSCDGRDASPAEEIERQRAGRGRARPVHNATWRTLSRGRRPSGGFHKTIMGLGDAPKNTAMLKLLDAAPEPGCYSLSELQHALARA